MKSTGRIRLFFRVVALAFALVGLAFIPASSSGGFDPFVNLAPLFVIVFLFLFFVALIFARDAIVLVAFAIAFASPASLVGWEVFAALSLQRVTMPNESSLKIVSANLWTRNTDYPAFIKFVEAEQPDVLILQEAFYGWRALLKGWLPRYRVTIAPYQFAAGCGWPHECNAVILSRLQKTEDPSSYTSSFATARLMLPDRLGGGVFEVGSVHLSRPPPVQPQTKEIDKLEQTVAGFSDKAIIAGDFNATPWSSAMKRLDRTLPLQRITRFLPSWPSIWPIAPVDHIYAGKAWEISDVRLGPNIGSDHRPIVATLALHQPASR